MTAPRRLVPLVVVLLVAVGGCHRRQTPAPAPVPATTARPAGIDSSRVRDSLARLDALRRAREDSVRAASELAAADAATLRATLTAAIHFDFDQADLTDDARAKLDAKLPILVGSPDVHLRIGGHTDERGSTEYNLALGLRRAAAAKRYLVERGVADGRIETASFGEEQPLCQTADESCWSQNRRDEFEITSGGSRLARGQP